MQFRHLGRGFAAVLLLAATSAPAQHIWGGGLLSLLDIPTTIPVGGTLAINTAADHDLPGLTLTNHGTITWNEGYVRGGNGSAIVNAADGTFSDLNGSSYTMQNPFGGGFVFTNQGSYVRNAGGTTFFDIAFDNTGSVSVQQGVIQFRAGGTMGGTGTMSAASGTAVHFTNGYSLQGGASLGGAGNFEHTGGTMTFDGTVHVGTYRQVGGALAGSYTVGSGVLTWEGGSWNGSSATTTLADPTILHITGGSDHDFAGRTITNHGNVTWHAGYIRGGNGSSFVNASDGVFNDVNASGYTVHNPFGGAFSFVNDGLYHRTSGGITFFDVPFINNGVVDLDGGVIQFRAGGTLATSGMIDAAPGTSVVFTNGFDIQNGASLTGAGGYHLANGTLSMSGTVNVGSFLQTNGAISGNQTIGSGVFTWQAGSWNGGGETTVVADPAILNITTGSDHDFAGRTITNHGTVNWHAGYIRGGNGSSFVNAADGVFNDLNASSYTVHNPFGGAFSFVNDGLYHRNTGGITFFDVPFINNGVVDLDGGVIQFRAGGTLASTATLDAAAGTSVVFTNGFNIQNGASLIGAGGYHLANGTLNMSGTVNVTSLLQTNGAIAGNQTIGSGVFTWEAGSWNGGGETTVIADPAVLNITTGSDHDFAGRTITNHGTVNWHAGYIRGGNGSSFVNAADGVFNDVNVSGYTVHNPFGGAFSFVNDGLYQRNTSGTTYFDVPFVNNGVVDLDGGVIQFRAGGTLAPTGSISAAVGTSVVFTNGFDVQNGASLTGGGGYHLANGTLSMSGTVNVGSILQTNGAIAGSQTIGSGVFTWEAGSWNGGGQTTTLAAATTLNITTGSDHDFAGRTVVNQGIVNWHTGYIRGGNGSIFLNAVGSTFNDFNVSGYTMHNPFGGSFSFVNDGTYVRSVGGTTYVDVPFDNGGTVVLEEGGLQLRGGVTLDATSALRFVIGGAGAGTDYGLLTISTAVVLDGQLQVAFANGFQNTISGAQTLTLLNSGGLSGVFTNVTNGARLWTNDGFGSFQVNYGAASAFAVNSVVLSDFQAVPEPSTWALMILGGAAIALGARRRFAR